MARGATTAITPGTIISRNALRVLMSTQRAESGLAVPSISPGISRNWRRTSSTMPWAARPTACIVSAEKINGSIAPITRPTRTWGCKRLIPVPPAISLPSGADLNQFGADRVRGQQRQRGKGRRADGEALAGGGGGVAKGVERVGALADLWVEVGLFGDTAGVIGHRPVGVGSQRDSQGGQQPDPGQGHTVEPGKPVGQENGDRYANNRYQGTHHPRGDALDDYRGGAGFGGGGHPLRRLVAVGSEVFGSQPDYRASAESGDDASEPPPVFGQGDGEYGGEYDEQPAGGENPVA